MISEYVDALFLTSTAYLIQSEDGSVAILCYRGTPPTSVVTWLTDFQIEPVTIDVPALSDEKHPAEVHSGFYRNVRSTRSRIVELLEKAIRGESILEPDPTAEEKPPTSRLKALYITGHSLGAASAALLAALLVAEDRTYETIRDPLKAVYTYGSPMIGNAAFANACDKNDFLRDNVFRYVYGHDVVPRVPPKASGDFRHFGREYRYTPAGANGQWHESKKPLGQLHNVLQLATAPLAILTKGLTRTRNIPFHASLSDHFPQYYLDALAPTRPRSEFGR